MGCGSSRMNSAEGLVPEKIRPLLFRRYEELKKRRQGPAAAMQRETTLSKKNLLKADEDINSNNSSDGAEAEYKPAVISPMKVEATNKVAPLPLESGSEHETSTDTENHKGNTEQQKLPEKEKDATGEEKNTKEAEETVAEKNEDEQLEEKSDDDEDGDDDDDFGFGDITLCPASPSFRIYCLPPQNNKDESKSQQEMVTSQKSSSVESEQSPASGHVKTPSVNSIHSVVSPQNSKILNECTETQSASKRRRNRKKKLQAVKNILVAKSLYTSCSCAGADRTRLAAAKSMK
ncbi:hypothetical protein QN277_006548 [Acacia crassicarpa]|uniref:Uncharacterized protein n=1 Tax=Acacia crassicarpa TaxID=499986 RepID=A0AAE1MBW8_9FABA|nr:hypothetical protein QN277_006548 [Acacia crassicarpa]